MSDSPSITSETSRALVDLSHHLETQFNWKCPLLCTPAVWDLIEDAVNHRGQSLNCLIHVISVRIMNAALKNPGEDTVFFTLLIGDRWHRLKARHIPLDGGGSPITVMLAREI